MKRLFVGLSITAVGLLAISSVASGDGSGASRHWVVDLEPLNDSGVSGTAHLVLDGDELTVSIDATGLEAGKPHAQHIHGSVENTGNATCPPSSADADGDGIVSVGEGLPFYGPVLLPLTPFSTAPSGAIDFDATYDGSALEGLAPINALQNRAIVVHGLTIDGVYVGSTPVACGQIRPEPRGR